jgi:hypothetical protein
LILYINTSEFYMCIQVSPQCPARRSANAVCAKVAATTATRPTHTARQTPSRAMLMRFSRGGHVGGRQDRRVDPRLGPGEHRARGPGVGARARLLGRDGRLELLRAGVQRERLLER